MASSAKGPTPYSSGGTYPATSAAGAPAEQRSRLSGWAKAIAQKEGGIGSAREFMRQIGINITATGTTPADYPKFQLIADVILIARLDQRQAVVANFIRAFEDDYLPMVNVVMTSMTVKIMKTSHISPGLDSQLIELGQRFYTAVQRNLSEARLKRIESALATFLEPADFLPSPKGRNDFATPLTEAVEHKTPTHAFGKPVDRPKDLGSSSSPLPPPRRRNDSPSRMDATSAADRGNPLATVGAAGDQARLGAVRAAIPGMVLQIGYPDMGALANWDRYDISERTVANLHILLRTIDPRFQGISDELVTSALQAAHYNIQQAMQGQINLRLQPEIAKIIRNPAIIGSTEEARLVREDLRSEWYSGFTLTLHTQDALIIAVRNLGEFFSDMGGDTSIPREVILVAVAANKTEIMNALPKETDLRPPLVDGSAAAAAGSRADVLPSEEKVVTPPPVSMAGDGADRTAPPPPAETAVPLSVAPRSVLRVNPLRLGRIEHGDATCWAATLINGLVGIPRLDEFLSVSKDEERIIARYQSSFEALSKKTSPDEESAALINHFLREAENHLPPALLALLRLQQHRIPDRGLITQLFGYPHLKRLISDMVMTLESGGVVTKSQINSFVENLTILNFKDSMYGDDSFYILRQILLQLSPPFKFPSLIGGEIDLTKRSSSPFRYIPTPNLFMHSLGCNSRSLSLGLVHMLFRNFYTYSSDNPHIPVIQKITPEDNLPPALIFTVEENYLSPTLFLERTPLLPYLDGAVTAKGYSTTSSHPEPYRLTKIMVHPPGHWKIYFYYNYKWYCSDDIERGGVRPADLREIQKNAGSKILVMYEKVPKDEITPDIKSSCQRMRTEWDEYREEFLTKLGPDRKRVVEELDQ